MVTLVDIIRGFTEALNTLEPTIPVVTKDTTEDLPRPCFYVCVDNIETFSGRAREDNYDMTIFYAASDRYGGWLELLKMQETLRGLLSCPVKVSDDAWVHPEDVRQLPDRASMWLETAFSITFIQARPGEELDKFYGEEGSSNELMEELILDKMKTEGNE